MYKQLSQVLSAARLISRSQGATIKELQERCGISRRSVYRLLETLEDSGYCLYDEIVGRERRIKLNTEGEQHRWWLPLPRVKLDFMDSVLLDYLFYEAAKTPALAEQVSRLRKKVSSLIADGGYSLTERSHPLGRSLQDYGLGSSLIEDKPLILNAEVLSKVSLPDEGQHLKTIFQAIKEKTVCVLDYEAIGTASRKTFRVHPLCFFQRQGGLYLFVLVPYYGSIRILAVNRIVSVDLTEEGFTMPEGFDPAAYLSDPFGIIQENPFVASIRFSDDQAPYIRELSWPEGTVLKDLESGDLLLSVKTSGKYELKRWVMSFGSDAIVIEPDWLRSEVLDDLKLAIEYYGT